MIRFADSDTNEASVNGTAYVTANETACGTSTLVVKPLSVVSHNRNGGDIWESQFGIKLKKIELKTKVENVTKNH